MACICVKTMSGANFIRFASFFCCCSLLFHHDDASGMVAVVCVCACCCCWCVFCAVVVARQNGPEDKCSSFVATMPSKNWLHTSPPGHFFFEWQQSHNNQKPSVRSDVLFSLLTHSFWLLHHLQCCVAWVVVLWSLIGYCQTNLFTKRTPFLKNATLSSPPLFVSAPTDTEVVSLPHVLILIWKRFIFWLVQPNWGARTVAFHAPLFCGEWSWSPSTAVQQRRKVQSPFI